MTKYFVIFIILFTAVNHSYSQEVGTVQGRVVAQDTKEPLRGTNIFIVDSDIGSISGANGEYTLSVIPVGIHSIQFGFIGYESKRINIEITSTNVVVELDVELKEKPIRLSEITVTPSQFSIMGSDDVSRQTLTRENIQTVSQTGEDIYRAITRLPGISGNDFSSKFTIRGGENEEVLVLMDGMELYEPFHVKDINGGVLSIIDVVAIDGIDLITGGFPVEYGDRTSGVFNIKSTKVPLGKKKIAMGISFMNTRFLMEGSTERSSWLLSARRGYLDMVLDLMGEEDSPSPTYYDILGKYTYKLNDKHTVSANILTSYDTMEFTEDDEDRSDTSYGNSYGWLTLKSILTNKIFVQNLVSIGRVDRDRFGVAYLGDTNLSEEDFTVSDERKFDILGFKQDWQLEVSDNYFVKCGFDLKKLSADYNYISKKKRWYWHDELQYWIGYTDTNAIDFDESGEKIGAYIANRIRPVSPLTLELGVRYDNVSYSDDELFSPRVNVAYVLSPKTSIRAGWGYFYQSEGMNELNIQDGDDEFGSAELAKHTVIGGEHYFDNGIQLRLEGYYKNYSDLRPSYRNWKDDIELFQEMQEDRVEVNWDGATVKGMELYLKKDTGGKFTWWASYGLSYATDDLASYTVNGINIERKEEISGQYDQRHTIYVDLNYRPNSKWHVNLAWQYHTGWPYTEKKLGIFTGDDGDDYAYEYVDKIYDSNYPAFHRLDMRVNRTFRTSKGTVSTFLEIINLYNHKNVRTYDTWVEEDGQGNFYQAKESEYWFKLLPSIGISWAWER